jgi:pyruvate dehydrogenase E2 component (dihydrolipoamide acetyltransferase)
MTSKDFKLPDLGEGVHEGQIVRMLVKPGDVVREDQPLMEVETDKAAVEIPCPFNGVVEKVHVAAGQLVHVGDVMVTFGEGSAKVETASVVSVEGLGDISLKGAVLERSVHPAVATLQRSGTSAIVGRRNPASPAVRKLARSLGVDVESIQGSGPGGRVQRGDVEGAAGKARTSEQPSSRPSPFKGRGSQASPIPQGKGSPKAVAAKVSYSPLPESLLVELPAGTDDADQYGPIRRVPLTQARKTIANVMTQSWTTIPHATDCDDADVTELEKLRKGYAGVSSDGMERKITMLAFVIRAVVRAIQRFPEFNGYFDAEKGQIVYRRYINVGVGVHTERGLIVPVLRDADQMSIPQISDELAVIAEKARAASFAVNDTRGGTYTLSNAGAMGGSRYSTPIITPGQAAVLAIGRSKMMPWVVDGQLTPRLIMPLSHSIDHRMLDGGQEIAFLQQVIGDLQNPARLLL